MQPRGRAKATRLVYAFGRNIFAGRTFFLVKMNNRFASRRHRASLAHHPLAPDAAAWRAQVARLLIAIAARYRKLFVFLLSLRFTLFRQ
jgi:hypothetical protein